MDIYEAISEDRYEELDKWDRAYKGGLIPVTKTELLEHMAYDALEFENANYHSECASMVDLIKLVETWQEDPPIGRFAYAVSDLGAVREFYVS